MSSLAISLYSNVGEGSRAATLGDNETHVWRFAYADATPDAESAILEWLPTSEAAAARRYLRSELVTRYVLRRGFMRGVLARYLGAHPRDLAFRAGPRGKPFLDGETDGLELNLSHTDDDVLLAVARRVGVGVDIERLAANIDPRALGRIVLAPPEARELDGLDGAELKRAFLRIWCRKEACLKAVGVGLLDDLTTLSVTGNAIDLGACRDRRIDPSYATVVHVHDLTLGDRHAGALATDVRVAPVGARAVIPRDELVVPPA